MPLTYLDIEKQKSWRIAVFFLVLLILYLVIAVLFAAAFFNIRTVASLHFWARAGIVSFLAAAAHFFLSAYDTVSRVIRDLNGQPPDREDQVHAVLAHIMQELHVVTGQRGSIRCMVIPTLSLNAMAATDLKGNAVIGITEGLLSRLTRPQLEAVIAHEAHHILSGDCLETTVASSLFGMYSSLVENMTRFSQGRFLAPAFLLAWTLLKLGNLLNLFISRTREYRADAASVRMTRNPLALAEALHLLSRSWRGAGFIGEGYESLCIVNPRISGLDEKEGFWPNLLSTHPPIRNRITTLLAMARVGISELDRRAAKTVIPEEGERFYAMSPGREWQGPFTLTELGGLPWLSPLTWVSGGNNELPDRAWKRDEINSLLTQRLLREEQTFSKLTCPSCAQPLAKSVYSGISLYQCRFCAGMLIKKKSITRAIARAGRGHHCSSRIAALARAAANRNHNAKFGSGRTKIQARQSADQRHCPSCANNMHRSFYSSAHPIEIDRCSYCGLAWFDQDELAMLQCLIENRIIPETTTEITLPAERNIE